MARRGASTDDTSPLLGGSLASALAAGETLRIYDGSTYLGDAAVTGTSWTFSDSRTLAHNQSVSYTARVADAAGNLVAGAAARVSPTDAAAGVTLSTVSAEGNGKGMGDAEGGSGAGSGSGAPPAL